MLVFPRCPSFSGFLAFFSQTILFQFNFTQTGPLLFFFCHLQLKHCLRPPKTLQWCVHSPPSTRVSHPPTRLMDSDEVSPPLRLSFCLFCDVPAADVTCVSYFPPPSPSCAVRNRQPPGRRIFVPALFFLYHPRGTSIPEV